MKLVGKKNGTIGSDGDKKEWEWFGGRGRTEETGTAGHCGRHQAANAVGKKKNGQDRAILFIYMDMCIW